jgi:hypothetical protein
MNATIENNIIECIVDRLRGITLVNDYAFDVVDVVRPDSLGKNYTVQDKLILVDIGNMTRLPSQDRPGNPPAIAYEMVVESRMILRHGDNAINVNSSESLYAAAAIKKAIATDSHWWQMNDNAFDSDIGEMVPYMLANGNVVGVMVPTTVRFRVSENNPFQTRS